MSSLLLLFSLNNSKYVCTPASFSWSLSFRQCFLNSWNAGWGYELRTLPVLLLYHVSPTFILSSLMTCFLLQPILNLHLLFENWQQKLKIYLENTACLQINFSAKPSIVLGLHFLRIHVMCSFYTNETISIVAIKWNLLSCSPVTCSKFALYMNYLIEFLLFLDFPRFGFCLFVCFFPFLKLKKFSSSCQQLNPGLLLILVAIAGNLFYSIFKKH